jgi:hypothetical protein
VLWRSEPGGRLRESAKKVAREVGPPLAEAAARALVLADQMSALAIDAPLPQNSALRCIAKILATRQTILTTAEVSRHLRQRGYRVGGAGSHVTQTRQWLLLERCFEEGKRGHWTLGYHAKPL